MKQGKGRFKIHLSKLEDLLSKASSQKSPALWLFQNDLRTPMFMLEGLSKLYVDLHNEKIFSKLQKNFKQAEDALGLIDYYAAFQKEFADNDQVPAAVKTYFEIKVKESAEAFDKILKEKGWLNGARFKKINKKLADVDWLKEETETTALHRFYKNEISKINSFIKETTFNFDNIEEDVHELRRKLRWLSIYPHALQGAIKLEETEPAEKFLQKYLTEDVTSSPFNKLPVAKGQTHFLVLEKNHFFALSWMIAKLGKIKDEGLKVAALQEALTDTGLIDDLTDTKPTYKILGTDYPQIEDLLKRAGEISQQFFKEKILEGLVR
jgi:hypothetical protein